MLGENEDNAEGDQAKDGEERYPGKSAAALKLRLTSRARGTYGGGGLLRALLATNTDWRAAFEAEFLTEIDR